MLLERDHELSRLRQAWRSAQRGHGSLWLLCAEAGGGKSRLAAELSAAAGGPVLTGAAEPVAPPVPFQALQQAIAGFQPAATRAETAATFADALAARGGPVLLVLDDLHFADEGTIAAMVRLGVQAGARPWLIVACFRPDEGVVALRQAVVELTAQGHAHQLDLLPLSHDAIAALATVARGDTLTEEELEQIVVDSGGNPWFVETMARADGAVSAAHNRLLMRIDRLEAVAPGAKVVLAALAPSTRRLSHSVVAELAGSDSRTLRRLLVHLRDAGILAEQPDGWGFRHELMRHSLLDAMTAAERRDAHRALGEVLTRHNSGAAELAMHFALAGDTRAGRWALQAATEARAVDAHAEAHTQLMRALASPLDDDMRRTAYREAAYVTYRLGRLTDSFQMAEAGLAIPGGEPEARAQLHWLASRAATLLGERTADERHLSTAEHLLDGRPASFVAVQVAGARLQRPGIDALPGQIAAAGARALAMVAQLDDPDAAQIEFELRRTLLGGPLYRGDPAVFADLEMLLRFGEAQRLPPAHAVSALGSVYMGATFTLFHRDAAEVYARAMEGIARYQFGWEGLLRPYHVLELVQRGLYAEARELSGTIAPPDRRTEQAAMLMLSSVLLEARAGSLRRAAMLLVESDPVSSFRQVTAYDVARLELATLNADPHLGELAQDIYELMCRRQYARVAGHAAVALAGAGREPPGVPHWLPSSSPLRVYWDWAAALQRRDAIALRDVASRLAINDSPYEAALALRDAGDLAEAYRALAELNATTVRQQVLEQLREAGQPIPRRTRASVARDGLTVMEREVCRLVAGGATSEDVAATLGVSVRTVESHLGRVYQKTGHHGRVAMALWWREQGG